jgi:hypothetical protein
LSHSDVDFDWFEVFVKSDHHSRVHSKDEVVQTHVHSSEEELLLMCTGEEHSEKTSQCHIGLKVLVGMNWLNIDETLSHVTDSLSDPDHEELIRIFVVVRSC